MYIYWYHKRKWGVPAKVTYIQDGENFLAAFKVEIYKSPFLPSLHRLLQTWAGFHTAYWAVSACSRVLIGLRQGLSCSKLPLLTQICLESPGVLGEGLTPETGKCWKKWVCFFGMWDLGLLAEAGIVWSQFKYGSQSRSGASWEENLASLKLP